MTVTTDRPDPASPTGQAPSLPVDGPTLARLLGSVFPLAAPAGGGELEYLTAVRLFVRDGFLVASATNRYAMGWMRTPFVPPAGESTTTYDGVRVSIPGRLIPPLLADIADLDDEVGHAVFHLRMTRAPGGPDGGTTMPSVATTLTYPSWVDSGRTVTMTTVDFDQDVSQLVLPLLAGAPSAVTGISVRPGMLAAFADVDDGAGSPLELSVIGTPAGPSLLRVTCGEAFLGALASRSYRGGVPGATSWESLLTTPTAP